MKVTDPRLSIMWFFCWKYNIIRLFDSPLQFAVLNNFDLNYKSNKGETRRIGIFVSIWKGL